MADFYVIYVNDRLVGLTQYKAVFGLLKELTRTSLSCVFLPTISFKQGNVMRVVNFLQENSCKN